MEGQPPKFTSIGHLPHGQAAAYKYVLLSMLVVRFFLTSTCWEGPHNFTCPSVCLSNLCYTAKTILYFKHTYISNDKHNQMNKVRLSNLCYTAKTIFVTLFEVEYSFL